MDTGMDRNGRGAALWVLLLTAASAATTLALACATPFSALAAIAATRLPARAAFALIALAWGVSQLVGFCLLDYPREPLTFAWGGAILTAAMASVAAAWWAAGQVRGGVAALAAAFGTGFVAYKTVLLGWSLLLGGVHTALSPYWTARQFGREALILIGLALLSRGLVALGVPAAARTRAWA